METAWKPELRKPEFPDLYGTCIILPIKAHRPPEPFGKVGYKKEKTPGVEDISREAIGHLSVDELTFARHPRERAEGSDEAHALPGWFDFSNTPTPVLKNNPTADLKIVTPISTGARGAKVVLCEVLSPAREYWLRMGHKTVPTVVAAKIFDPLFYYNSPDMVGEADREYPQEAAAYIHMHDQRNTETYTKKPGLVPRFYGTWTTDITVNHLRKPFMNQADRQATRKQETQDRVDFDAAAAATKASGSSPKPNRLEPHKFRPVRIILLEYIKGYPLSSFLIRTRHSRHKDAVIVNPTAEFASESLRLAIFGNIMDTLSRVEHLGIKPVNISPSMFMITKRPRTVTPSGPELKYDYDVVMTDFSQADVTKYTRIGFDVHEKLPRPMHPLSARSPLAWYSFYGWVPPSWFNPNNASAYSKWGAAFFKITDYSTPDVVNRVAEEEGWLEAMKKAGNLPPQDDDPELQERTRKMNSLRKVPAMKYQSEKNFATKEEFDKDRADARKAIAAQRAEHAEQQRKKRADLVRRCEEKARQLDEEKRTKEAQFSSMGPPLVQHVGADDTENNAKNNDDLYTGD